MQSLPPLLLIDKPKGMSSFSVIRQLRRRTGIHKFGHAGTLDPLATGLLLIGVQSGTKLLTDLVGLDKEYVAEILLGEQRSTGDMDGTLLNEREYVGDLTSEKLQEALGSLLGEVLLPVSAYSAIKVNGVPLYKKARKAAQKAEQITDVPERIMRVHKVELLKQEELVNEGKKRLLLSVRFMVGSGTYIRSLAEELGRRLDYPATLANLRRTKVGEYRIEDAQQLSEFTQPSVPLWSHIKVWYQKLRQSN